MVNNHLFWSWYEPRNFGDWIGPYLYHQMRKRPPIYCPKRLQSSQECVFSVGSILRHIIHPDRVTVWGSGIISEKDVFPRPLKTLAVRGPKTRQAMLRLGFDCPEVYGDPAVLLPLYFDPPERTQAKKVGIIPHFIELEEYKKRDLKDVTLIDVCQPVENVVSDIKSVEMTYSSSLHGLIVSHTYGIPSIWMESSIPLMGDGVKFRDYYASCGISTEPRLSILHVGMTPEDDKFATLPSHVALRKSLLSAAPEGWMER